MNLLVLNRFGVDYRQMQAAVELGRKYKIEPQLVLLAAGLVTSENLAAARHILNIEQQKAVTRKLESGFLLNNAVHGLFNRSPHYSARYTVEPRQMLALGLAAMFVVIGLWMFPHWLVTQAFALLSMFYGTAIIMRCAMIAAFGDCQRNNRVMSSGERKNLPVYTVLVALYQEADQVCRLVDNLCALDWPSSKLDIKLICEADDHQTLSKIQSLSLPTCFETVRVPPANPRTKPKALNFALQQARGEYLVVYDAEDCPSPRQLKEAYCRFRCADEKVACLQAPLRIHNQSDSWLSCLFAIEYLVLFNGMLPVLANWRVPLPLGGTSNHFKMEVLRSVGGWDPYNVTEDADLGIRLFREGYRCETLSCATYEEAPHLLSPWLKQRTRWIKGWMQTILVHSRQPLRFAREMGFGNTVVFHLFLTSIVISTLIHPFFFGLLVWKAVSFVIDNQPISEPIIVGVSTFNLVGGYSTYMLFALAVLRRTPDSPGALYILSVPVYWVLISMAGWRALVHLILKPHHWEKTPHGLTNTLFVRNFME